VLQDEQVEEIITVEIYVMHTGVIFSTKKKRHSGDRH